MKTYFFLGFMISGPQTLLPDSYRSGDITCISLWKCSWIHECSIHSSVHHPQGVNSDTRMHESSLSRTTVAQLLCIYYFHCTFLFHVATDTTGKLLCNSLLIFLSLQSALLSLLSVHCKCFNIVQPDMQMDTRQKAFY